MPKTPSMRLKEIELGRPLEQVIREGVDAGMNWVEIAGVLGIPYATLTDWRRALGIKTVRTIEFVPVERTVAR
jgi:hypothetical protein